MAGMAAHLGYLPQDGLVTVEASTHGEFVGCIPADHMDQVGDAVDRRLPRSGFDRIRFYLNVTDGLAAEGL